MVGTAGLLLVPNGKGEEVGTPNHPIRIGVSGSLFRDVPASIVSAMSRPFNKVMVSQTGMTGELTKVSDPLDLAKQVISDSTQLGIFTSYELAWARQKHPDLKPLMTLVSEGRHPQVLVVVPAASSVQSFADLKGLTLSRPRASRPYALLFLERRTQALGGEPKQFFADIHLNPESTEVLDDVVEGKAQAALVDCDTWDWYRRTKPKRTAQLRVAVESEKFPATVVVYYPGNLDEKVVKRFRQGMLCAHDCPTGRQLMSLWKISGFQDVPKDYEDGLKEILKAYPPPADTKEK